MLVYICISGVLLDISIASIFFFFKQKTAYEMRISDWSSDVCSSDLIVPGERIIIAYAMTVGGNRISVSQATMQFEPAGSGTRLVFTEQDAFLDGYDDAGQRAAGMRELLEALDRELRRQRCICVPRPSTRPPGCTSRRPPQAPGDL